MHVFIAKLARGFTLLGGLVLSVLIVLTCLSIAGRTVNTILYSDVVQTSVPDLAAALLGLGVGAIPGDFEIVEAGMAFVIFAFIPLCQLGGGHASVDIFTSRLPPRVERSLRCVIEIVFAAVLVLIAWELFAGMESKRRSAQTSFLLEYPVWWGYAFALSGAVAAAIVAIYVAVMRVVEIRTGRVILPSEMEADH